MRIKSLKEKIKEYHHIVRNPTASKAERISVTVVAIGLFLILLLIAGKVAGEEGLGAERRIIRIMQSVESQLQGSYTRIETARDEYTALMNTELERIHEAAEELRKGMCAMGATTYCPIIEPEVIEVAPATEFYFVNRPLIVGKTYTVSITSYNPVPEQTDSSPCIGASGQDLCVLAGRGEKIIALSQELVGRARHKPFKYGDYINVEHDNIWCKGVYKVMDTMNARFYLRADIFHMNPEDNFGRCDGAEITKVYVGN